MRKLNDWTSINCYIDPYLPRTMRYDGYYEEDNGDYTDVRGRGRGCGYNIKTSIYKKTETAYLEYEDLKGQGVSKDVLGAMFFDDFCEASLPTKLYNGDIDNPYYHDTGYM